ncbi:hypothetical protein KAFR_0J01590 [Kazachstania africana CBS 2517]|uniref:Vacuolar membrane protein n=1 Tax=Kazachstania africana (strain ATCC 22294 / BCRC 22015 / CBS 2517 / CECT 1963 / NBRC 1671 / NRRL Y-8276) TaxID=1071382 RepID=H2B0S4_KAZAF|nr:hypothetical protein KAFR_0J01590 [Kazachstania africana CBS 2517]CCF60224.1 hypothetical protein KAFR_0J01590 [Kazachstania africana CBS 2517]
MSTIVLYPRSLPELITTTTQTTQSSKDSSTKTTATTSASNSVTTSASQNASLYSSQSSSSITPTITPPSASRNPHVMQLSHMSQGTLYIAVGTVIGFIMLASIIGWLFTGWLSRRHKLLYAEQNYYDYINGNGNNSPNLSYSSSNEDFDNEKLLNEKMEAHSGNNADSTIENCKEMRNTDVIKSTDTLHLKNSRNSMFISPTVYIMSEHSRKLSKGTCSDRQSKALSTCSIQSFQDIMQLQRPEQPMLIEKPKRASRLRFSVSSDDGYVDSTKINSSLMPSASNLNVQRDITKKAKRKSTPSMYLDDLLESSL